MTERELHRRMLAGLDRWPEKRPKMIVFQADERGMVYAVDTRTGDRVLRIGSHKAARKLARHSTGT